MPLDARMARVRAAVAACDASPAADCVVYISKMFSVPKASLPDPAAVYEQGDGTAGGNAAAFPAAMLPAVAQAWIGTGALENADGAARESLDLSAVNSSTQRSRAMRAKLTEKRRAAGGGDAARDVVDDAATGPEDEDEDPAATETMIAFARVFSGVLRPDAPVFVLGPRYDPAAPHAGACAHVSQVTRPMPLYMMMGRELFPMREARAGSVIGIGACKRGGGIAAEM
jgi:ribosome assembly protein 1